MSKYGEANSEVFLIRVKPKLIHFSSHPSTFAGGTEKIVQLISQVAAEMGFDCEEVFESQFALKQVSRRYSMLNTPANVFQMSWQARRRLAQADVIVSHGIHGPFLRRSRRIHVLHSTHSGTADAMRPHIPSLDYLAARYLWGQCFEGLGVRAQQSVAVSKAVADQARRYYGRTCQVIPNAPQHGLSRPGVSREESRARLRLPPEKKLMLIVGRRERLKGWQVISNLLESLPEQVCIVWVGSGPGDTQENLLIRQTVSPEELSHYYHAADWLLSASLYEGFGLTLLEAWGCDTPVLATPVGLAADLFGEEAAFDHCVASRADCSDSLLRVIQRACSDPDLARRQLVWAQEHVLARYSMANFKLAWQALLTQFLR